MLGESPCIIMNFSELRVDHLSTYYKQEGFYIIYIYKTYLAYRKKY